MLAALSKWKPTVDEANIAKYREFTEEYGEDGS